jgi:hypothetical protein
MQLIAARGKHDERSGFLHEQVNACKTAGTSPNASLGKIAIKSDSTEDDLWEYLTEALRQAKERQSEK